MNKGGEKKKEQGWGVPLARDFFCTACLKQHLVNLTQFYLEKCGVSPRTSSEAGQDKVTSARQGR